METVQLLIMWVIGLGIYNVWLLRASKSTAYRAGKAMNMREEFDVYGLGSKFMVAVGILKVALATAILVGTWVPSLILPATGFLGLLMLGAIAMHIKVRDTLKKTAPATLMFILCISVVALERAA